MKKAEKHNLLCTKLSSFGIKPLTNWVARLERDWHLNMARIREEMVGIPTEEMEQAFQGQADKQIQTVGCLIRNYPYRFMHKWYQGDGGYNLVGLGREPIAQLKKKLVSLGLTPDDWPALVDHDKLLEHLSKKTILELPLLEVCHMDNGFAHSLDNYLGCEKKELPKKTMKDFIAVNPSEVTDSRGVQFFKSRQRQFIAIRQKLVAKGFSTRDGAFFKWNPEKKSLEKARRLLTKHQLRADVCERFARILVSERLVT